MHGIVVSDDSAVNSRRHASCKRGGSPGSSPRSKHPGLLRNIPEPIQKEYPFITSKNLKADDRHYLLSMASVYTMSRMKALKQDQYRHLLHKQYALGKLEHYDVMVHDASISKCNLDT